jgi:6-phosphogluconolactonase
VQTLAFPDLETAGSAACDIVLEEIEKALRALRAARIILAGGTTPRDAYKKLARRIVAERLPVGRLRWFFGDERWVPRDHPRSNEAMAREALLDPIGAPGETVFSWRAGFGSPVECALRYAETVRRLMGREGSRPDILLMGMGADGHTASLFPDGVAHLPGGTERAVGPDLPGEAAAVYVPSAREWRLTLCPLFLRTARCTAFLVSGEDKSAALRRALQGDPAIPASWVRGKSTLFLATRDAFGREGGEAGGETRRA